MQAVAEPVHFEPLDACHRQIHSHLASLTALVRQLDASDADEASREQARTIEAFFSGSSRQHHADEERDVFPPLLASPDEALVRAVRSLQQDHGWIEENWLELSPQLRAIADGHGGFDWAEFAHAAEVFLTLCEEHIALEESLIYPASKAQWAQQVAARERRLQRSS